jgi:tRNA(Ile)-lysidine synthase
MSMMATRAPLLVAVAASGGRDSTALLHCVVHQAKLLSDVSVVALHVNHGLMPQAATWQSQLTAQVRRWATSGLPVRIVATRLQTAPQPGRSIEEWARTERYVALARMAQEQGARVVLLAQHGDDQAETVLLQALRGAGPAGLSAMARSFTRHGVAFARPWLGSSGSAIAHYIERRRLRFVIDTSNADTRFDRSRLRSLVMPALCSSFPHAQLSLVQVASRAQEADACLRELAAVDLAVCINDGRLIIASWMKLSMPRRRNVLRHWLTSLKRGTPTPQLIERLITELPEKRVGQWPCAAGTLLCHLGLLQVVSTEAIAELPPQHQSLVDLAQPGCYRLGGWSGVLVVSEVLGQGVKPGHLKHVRVKQRTEGLQFQRAPNATLRAVKKEFQVAGVPSWLRKGPVLYSGDQLLFIAGLGVDGRVQDVTGQQVGRSLEWVPNDASLTP